MIGFFKKRPYIQFLIPGLFIYTLFVIYPIIYSFPISLTRWSGFGEREFIGLGNYIQLFTHPSLSTDFFNALIHNAEFFALMALIAIPVCIFLAFLMYREIPGYGFMEIVVFLPNFINVVAIGLLVTLFFDSNIGLMSKIFDILNIKGTLFHHFYSEPRYSIPLTFIVQLWRGVGYSMLLFLAAFKLIPKELEEAAIIDGSNELQRFFRIYLPLIAPTIINIFILSYIWSITNFEIPFILGGPTGGVGKNMDFVTIFFYRTAFAEVSRNSMGMGTTIAVCTFIILLIGTFFQFRIFMKRSAI